jgi:hypothetical protein
MFRSYIGMLDWSELMLGAALLILAVVYVAFLVRLL